MMSKTLRKIAIFLIFNLISIVIILLLCEGLASVILFFQTVTASPPVAERQHTQYEPTLGWVNRPNVTIADLYGPGLDLQTNSQGFRNRHDFSREVPPGKIRLICSGDSFTLGYGVDNDDTWCQQLENLDKRLETVNMGQGGYGIDQAYLWYKQDGVQLDHDVQVFAFITTDFERMQQTEFFGYGKPLLRIEDSELVIDNVPVPQRAFYLPWLTHNRQAIRQLTSVQLLSQFLPDSDTAQARTQAVDQPRSEQVAAAILKDLLQLNRAKGSTLVLAYLPTLGDYQTIDQSATETWRNFLNLAAQETGVVYIDLIETFRSLPTNQVQTMFIPEGELDFPGAAGHYSVEGNQWVASSLHEVLLAMPDISTKLADVRQ